LSSWDTDQKSQKGFHQGKNRIDSITGVVRRHLRRSVKLSIRLAEAPMTTSGTMEFGGPPTESGNPIE